MARSVPDARAIADRLKAEAVKLAPSAAVYDPTDPMGKMLINTLTTFTEFKADLMQSQDD